MPCAVILLLLLSSFTAQAILVHAHHGHEIHVHSLMVHDLDEWRENSEHQHEEHAHDDRPEGPPQDEDPSTVRVLALPEALPRVRGLSSGVAVSNIAPALTVLATDASAASDRCLRTRSRAPCAHAWHARSPVADILLAGHALLL